MTNDEIEAVRSRYIESLAPLFLPDDPFSNDIINYFASLLRVVGMEDGGWDPHLESRALLEDLNDFMQLDPPPASFADFHATTWRIGLLLYSHIVEMDAPYEVLANLLRFRLGKGYSPNPFHLFLSDKEKNKKGRGRLSPSRRIAILKQLAGEAGLPLGAMFDDYYDADLRNAIAHSDFILTEDSFRSRGGSGGMHTFSIPLERLNEKITKAKAFISMFLSLDIEARRRWGNHRGRGIPYDLSYKALMEILSDHDGLLVGFKVHWPNNSESVYRRTSKGIEMKNCYLDLKNATIQPMVGLYAQHPDPFSPLVEHGQSPVYTPLDGSEARPIWNEDEVA